MTGGCLISEEKPSFQPVLPQSAYPYSPRFEAQEAAITNFVPATNRVVFDLGPAPNSPEFHGPEPQTAARVDEKLADRGVAVRAMKRSSPRAKCLQIPACQMRFPIVYNGVISSYNCSCLPNHGCLPKLETVSPQT